MLWPPIPMGITWMLELRGNEGIHISKVSELAIQVEIVLIHTKDEENTG
jgi:hypothetical protein